MRLHRTGFIQMCLMQIKILQWRQNLSAHLRITWSGGWRKMNWNGFERKRFGLIAILSLILLGGTDKHQEKHAMVGASVEIRTEHFPHRDLEL